MRKVNLFLLSALCMMTFCSCAGISNRSSDSEMSYQDYYDLGVRYLSEGNYEEAIIAFTAAIEIDPKQAPVYIGRGDAYVGLGETAENLAAAQADYEKAIELDDTLVDAYLGLADVYMRQGDYDKAREILQFGAGRTMSEEIAEKLEQIVVDIRFTQHDDMDYEYAVIQGVNSSGHVQWTYTTPESMMTELTQMEEIGPANGLYYFTESGTVVALNPNTGEVVWKNSEFGGASICFAFGEHGELFLTGAYGPDFFWVDISGETIKRIEYVDTHYHWPSDIQYRGEYVEITKSADDGSGERIFTVSLDRDTDDSADSAWRQAYLAYIQGDNPYGNELSEETFHFQLIYVDNNDIPELWLCSDIIAVGGLICTFDGEQVNDIYISEYGNFQYIERSGQFHTCGGHSDIYWDGVYELRDGQFVERNHGDYGAENNADVQYDENREPIYQYNWNGQYVSEQEYKDSLSRAFDMSAAHNIFDRPQFNYNELYYMLSN